MDAGTPSTVVLIHGPWMTPRSWESRAARYEERGHCVTAAANRVLFQVGLANPLDWALQNARRS